MQLSFIALYVNPESVFKSCFTSRGLGDKGCHLVESPLQYLEDKGFSTPLQHYYNFFYLVTIQSNVFVVDLVLTLPSI